jgi:hypothetical protein
VKIGLSGIELPEGKTKYHDDKLEALVRKDQPRKISPFYVELVKEDLERADAILVHSDHMLDFLIPDLEKCEARLGSCDDEEEAALLRRCLARMEEEIPLCDVDLSDSERRLLSRIVLLSLKPIVEGDDSSDEKALIRQALDKAGIVFFYTTGPREVRAWPVPRGSDVVSCAGKIHTDLARGFIKGDVIGFEDYIQCHNFNDGRKKGLVKVVDRDHVIEDGSIVEIRFAV